MGVTTTYYFWGDAQNIGNYYPGVTLGPDAVILGTDHYGYNDLYYPAHSGAAVFRPYASGGVDFVFDGTVDYFEGWFTFWNAGYMEGYDAANNLIASTSMGGNAGSNALMSLSAPGMKRVRIHDNTDYWTGDDIAFEAGEQVIPEPTSLILGALGLSSLAGIRRFRRI